MCISLLGLQNDISIIYIAEELNISFFTLLDADVTRSNIIMYFFLYLEVCFLMQLSVCGGVSLYFIFVWFQRNMSNYANTTHKTTFQLNFFPQKMLWNIVRHWRLEGLVFHHLNINTTSTHCHEQLLLSFLFLEYKFSQIV